MCACVCVRVMCACVCVMCACVCVSGSVRTFVTTNPEARANDAVITTIATVGNGKLSEFGAIVPEQQIRVLW